MACNNTLCPVEAITSVIGGLVAVYSFIWIQIKQLRFQTCNVVGSAAF